MNYSLSIRQIVKLILTLFIVSPSTIVAQEQKTDPAASAQLLKKLSIEELMSIEVTSAAKKPQPLSETSSAIQVITQEDIRSSGVTTLPEALKLASNLQVAQVNSSQWAISARGFNNVLANKLLVLVDGRVVYTPMYSGVFWDVQNYVLEDIERIEVISGPGGTLWGANAVNGVVNIITKNANETEGLFIEGAGGTELRGLGSIRYGGRIHNKLSYRVYGTAFKKDHTLFFPDSIASADDWQMAQGGLRLDWDLNEKDNISFQSNFYDGRPDPDGGNPVEAKGSNFLVKWNRARSPESDLQLQAYLDHTSRDFRNGFVENVQTIDLEAQHRFKLSPRQDVVYGAGFRAIQHDVENLQLFGFFPPKKSLFLFNVFVQDAITVIRDRLKVIAGIKLENYTYSGFQYLPNIRLNWRPHSNQTIWAAASRAIRNPSRIDREFSVSIAPGVPFIIGNDAKPEELISYELGWHSQVAASISLSLSAYYSQYDNIRGVEPAQTNASIPLIFTNTVEGTSHGAELAITCQVASWWRVRGGYNFFEKNLSVKKGRLDSNNASAESNDPSHQVLIQSTINMGDRAQFGAVGRYVSKLPDPSVADYVGIDVTLAYSITKNLQVNVVGQNLAQKNHIEFIPDSPEPKAMQRSVYVKAALRF